MKNLQKRLWQLNILVFVFSLLLLFLIDMSGEVLGFGIEFSYISIGVCLILGVAISVVLLLKKTKARWRCYALIAFYLLCLSPFFVQRYPNKERVQMILIRMDIWPEGHGKTPNLPLTLTKLPHLGSNLTEIEKTQLENSKKRRFLIYNPKGIKDKTWVAYLKSNDFKSYWDGVVVLWYDGKINRVKEKQLKDTASIRLKYYVFK